MRLCLLLAGVASVVPAAAEAQVVQGAPADALALMMTDKRISADARRPKPEPRPQIGFDMRAEAARAHLGGPAATRLAAFESLVASAPAFEARSLPRDPPLTETGDVPDDTTAAFAGSYAVREGLKPNPPPRRRALLSGSVVLNLDGKEETPSLKLGGAAAVLNVLPR
jgi:hypothetical protein